MTTTPNTIDDIIDPGIAAERRRDTIVLIGRIAISVGLILAWEIAGPHLDKIIFSTPSDIAWRLWQWTTDGTLLNNLAVTTEEIILGYALGAAAGVALGLVMGSYPVVARIFDPILMAVYGVPKIAFGPLFIVWFGINLTPKVVITALVVFFFVFLSTYEGARNVDRDLVRVVKLMGASAWQERRLVVIPGALPAIMLGLKLAIPEALVGAIVGELIVSSRGIGYLVQFSASQLDSAGVFAGLFVLMALALVFNSAVNYATGKSGGRRA